MPLSRPLVLGLSAFAFVGITFAAAWLSLPAPILNPARYVPAADTVALLSNVTKETLPPFAATFPILARVPVTEQPTNIAILKTASGLTGFAVLTPRMDQTFTTTVSDPALSPLLAHIDSPLSGAPRYRLLQQASTASLPTAWLRFPDIHLSPASPLVSLVQTNGPLSIGLTDDGWNTTLLAPTDINFPALTTGPKDLFDHPLLILHASNGTMLLRLLSAAMQPTPRVITQTVLSQAVTTLFGTSLSPQYDLLPLLNGTTTLQAATGTGGHLQVVLEGNTPGDSALLDRMMTAFRSSLATITVHTETFDTKFHWQDVRQDTDLITDTTTSINGWTLRTIRQTASKQLLCMGRRGSRYILSTTDAACAKAASTEDAPLSSLIDPPVALGLVNGQEFRTLLLSKVPTIAPLATIPTGTGGYLKWKMTQNSSVLSVLFKKI